MLAGCKKNGPQSLATGESLPPVNWPDPPRAPLPPDGGSYTPPIVSGTPISYPPPPPGPATNQPAVQQAGLIQVNPRSAWTTAGLYRPSNTRPMNGIRAITVHHDGLSAFFDNSDAGTVQRLNWIRNGHIGRRSKSGEPWADIGYHYIIDRNGRVWEGRPIRFQGAHVQDHNENNIGVLVMGNFERQQPSSPQLATVDRFVAQLMRQHRVSLASVRTHREWNPTECPGRNLQAYMSRTRSRGGSLAMMASDIGLA